MNELPGIAAWLEKSNEQFPLRGNCSLGRAPANHVVLPDERVSRRHAIIHAQADEEEEQFWLVDLGSSNGSYLNGRRVTQPVRLQENDTIQIGPFQLQFRQPSARPEGMPSTSGIDRTRTDFKTTECWLLVADIVGSAALAQQHAPPQLSSLFGHWFLNCKQAIEQTGGSINKYLGDGFFAYWHGDQAGAAGVAAALEALRQFQDQDSPRFRIVLHYGKVCMGGVASMGEESLSGPEVNFVFRMEKVAASLKKLRLLSAAACAHLGATLPTLEVGEYPVPSFQGVHTFFSY